MITAAAFALPAKDALARARGGVGDGRGGHGYAGQYGGRGVVGRGYYGGRGLYGGNGGGYYGGGSCWVLLWMPPLLQVLFRRFDENPRLLSSIRPVMTTRPAPSALMVIPQAETQSRVTSSRLDAPSGFIQLRFARFRHHTLKNSSQPRRPLDQPVSANVSPITRLVVAASHRRRRAASGPIRSVPFCSRARRLRHWRACDHASAPATSMIARAIA